MKIVGLLLLFVLSTYASAKEALNLSKEDASYFQQQTAFPLTDSKKEDGSDQIWIQTHGLETGDAALQFVCEQRVRLGIVIQTDCRSVVDAEAKLSPENQVLVNSWGAIRATINNKDDLSKIALGFSNSGACRSDVATQLYASQERREVTLPTGKKAKLPLLSIICFGEKSGITRFVATMLPRASVK